MKKLLISALVFLSGLIFTGCEKGQETKVQKDSLSIAMNNWVGDAPLYVAQEKGFFDKYNLDVDLEVIEDFGLIKAAFASRQVDIALVTTDVALTMVDAGIDFKGFFMIDASDGADGIVAGDDIKTFADFKGKTVAGETGSPASNLFLYFLEQNGVGFSDIVWQEMKTNEAALAFGAGKADGAAIWEPYMSQVTKKRGFKIADSGDAPYAIVDVLVADPRDLEKQEDVYRRLAKALDEAINYIHDYPEDAIKISADKFKLDEAEIEAIFADLVFPKKQENLAFLTSPKTKDIFDTFAKAMKKAGVLKTDVHTSDLVTGEFLR